MTFAKPPSRVPPLWFPTFYQHRVKDLGISPGAVIANRAYYLPFHVPFPFIVDKVQWFNGASPTGNVDCGLYDAAGTRLFSTGSTAQSGASQIQEVNITDYLISTPGLYYAAIASSTTNNLLKTSDGGAPEFGRMRGWLTQSSAFPLPSTATFAAWSTGDMPVVTFVTKMA